MNETLVLDPHNDMAVLRLDAVVWARWANIVVKAALFVSFAVALTVDLDTLDGKAMGMRAPLFLPIVGNLFGSNIFNSLAVAGVAAVVGTGRLHDSPSLSVQIMVVVTLLALVTGARKEHFSRPDGIVLLAAYPAILFAGL